MNPIFKKPFIIGPTGRVKRALFADGYSSPIAEIRATPEMPGCVLDDIAQFLASAPLMFAALERATETINALLASENVHICSQAGDQLDELDTYICQAIRAAHGITVAATAKEGDPQ